MLKFCVSDLYAIDIDFINDQLDSLCPSNKENIDYINQCQKTISDYLKSDSVDILNKGSNSEYSTVFLKDEVYGLDKFIFLGLQLAFIPSHKVNYNLSKTDCKINFICLINNMLSSIFFFIFITFS